MRLLLASPLLFLSAACAAASCEHRADRSFEVDRSGVQSLAVRLGSTDLELRGVPGLQRIEVRATACASSADALERLQVSQRRDGDRVEVTAERSGTTSITLFGSTYAYIDLEIRVPGDLRVEVDTGSGDVDARNLDAFSYKAGSGDLELRDVSGNVVVEVGSGDVEAENVGTFVLTATGSGDIEVDRVKGAVQVGRVGSGDVTFTKVGGSVDIERVGSGDVVLRDVEGNVRIGSIGSGDVTVNGVRGDLTVQSKGSGDISHRDVGGRIDVPAKR